MTTPFNRYVKERFAAKKKEEEENKENIRVNGEDSKTEEDTGTSTKYYITDESNSEYKPESETKEIEKTEAEVFKPSWQDLQEIKEKMENGTDSPEQDFKTLFGSFVNHDTSDSEQELTEELLQKRYPEGRQVLASIFNTTEDRVSFTKKEAQSGDIVCHYGKLHFENIENVKDLKLPSIIMGDVYFWDFTLAEGLELPETVSGDLIFFKLNSTNGLKLPNDVGGNLNLWYLETAEGLELPNNIGGWLNFWYLPTLRGITRWPSYIKGGLYVSEKLSEQDKAFIENKYPGQIEYRY